MKYTHLISPLCLFAASIAPATAWTPGASGTIVKSSFGKTAKGEPVYLYTLTNKHKMTVAIMTYGATVQRVAVPDKHGKLGDVVLGFDDIGSYEKKSPYFGATVGRFANRIAKGTFSLDGTTYNVPVNNGPNSLHGGLVGYDKRIWKAKPKYTQNGPSITFTLHDPDGDQGYPGNVDVKVVFTVTDANTLSIKYTATTDKDTPINLTNHSYWNLRNAGKTSIKPEIVKIFSTKFTPTDDTLIPTGQITSVVGTPYDFRKPKPIGKDLMKAGAAPPKGYDMNFVLANTGALKEAVEVTDPASGRVMKIYTTEPAIQFYAGCQLDGTVVGKGGTHYNRYSAFAFEAQHYPDSPNHANFPSSILKPGQVYKQTTEYRFSVKK